MAFTGTGTAAFTSVTNSEVRIIGTGGTIILAAGATVTIGLFGDATADEQLPDNFDPEAFGGPSAGGTINLDASIKTTVNFRLGGAAPPDVSIQKALPFQITLTNNSASDTPDLEIYVKFK